MNRRNFLSNTLLSASAATLPFSTIGEDSPSVISPILPRKRVIRVAHLTDIHLKPDKIAEEGLAKALKSVQNLNPKPDFILNGGDSIMDALYKTKDEVKTQWALYKSIMKAENSIPVTHVIGNHDVWGWLSKSSDALKNDKLYGKAWVVDELKMSKRYYSFERSGWKFIVLDSTQINPSGGYTAYIDGEQFEWLKMQLTGTVATKHICIVSHIPILSMCSGLFFGKTEANGDLLTKNNIMHRDFFKIKNLFKNHANIKLCLSGHVHLQDSVDYLGIKYYCDGAVCGGWWRGNYQDFAPAYAVLDYYDDGSFERYFVNY
ncbi:MAG: metallophosphoesterase [Saprospiraceae bacterium]|nr:metallophosphoesterase [Saprospiraceae bacterium]